MLKRDIGAIWSKGEKTMLKKLTAFLTAAVMVTSVASIRHMPTQIQLLKNE